MNEIASESSKDADDQRAGAPTNHAGSGQIFVVVGKLVAIVLLLIGTIVEAAIRAISLLSTPPV